MKRYIKTGTYNSEEFDRAPYFKDSWVTINPKDLSIFYIKDLYDKVSEIRISGKPGNIEPCVDRFTGHPDREHWDVYIDDSYYRPYQITHEDLLDRLKREASEGNEIIMLPSLRQN